MNRARFVFIVDDDALIASLAGALAADGFDFVFARDWDEGRLSIAGGGIGVVVVVESRAMPSHADELPALRQQHPALVTVLLKANDSGRGDGAHLVTSKHAGFAELFSVFHDAESVRQLTSPTR